MAIFNWLTIEAVVLVVVNPEVGVIVEFEQGRLGQLILHG